MRIWIDLRTKCLLSFLVPFLIGLGLGDSHLVTLFLFSLAVFLCNLCFLCFLFADVPSLLYFCFADAYLHLAVFLNILSLLPIKKKKNLLAGHGERFFP